MDLETGVHLSTVAGGLRQAWGLSDPTRAVHSGQGEPQWASGFSLSQGEGCGGLLSEKTKISASGPERDHRDAAAGVEERFLALKATSRLNMAVPSALTFTVLEAEDCRPGAQLTNSHPACAGLTSHSRGAAARGPPASP